MNRRTSFAAILLAVSLLAIAGCRSDWGTATGAVTLDGKRMNKGSVTFHPVSGGPLAYGTIDSSGTYRAATGTEDGLKTGEYVVTVIDQNVPDSSSPELVKFLTPEKYAAPTTSDLKVTVKSGGNTFDFTLKK